jgi:hypothetical protein
VRLKDAVTHELQPHGAIEGMLVDGIIGDLWRLKRLERAEAAHWKEQIRSQAIRRRRARETKALRDQGFSGPLSFLAQPRIDALHEAKKVAPKGNDLEVQLARSVSDLERLQISLIVDRLRQRMMRRMCQSRTALILIQNNRSNRIDSHGSSAVGPNSSRRQE